MSNPDKNEPRPAVKFTIPVGTPAARCRGCGARIYWIITSAAQNRMPVDPDGTSHFATCPVADQFRKPKAQGELFD